MSDGGGAPTAAGRDTDGRVTVLYNGDCPVCASGIAVVRRCDPAADHVDLIDVQTTPEALTRAGVTKDDVVRRLHTVGAQGDRQRGIAAFAAIGEAVPRLRWLAALSRLPVIGWLAHHGYERLLVPALYRWNQARARRRMGRSQPAPDRFG